MKNMLFFLAVLLLSISIAGAAKVSALPLLPTLWLFLPIFVGVLGLRHLAKA
jgi:hypothetical protein